MLYFTLNIGKIRSKLHMPNVSKYCPPYILGLKKETPRNVFVRWSVAKISEFLPLFNVLSFSVARVASFLSFFLLHQNSVCIGAKHQWICLLVSNFTIPEALRTRSGLVHCWLYGYFIAVMFSIQCGVHIYNWYSFSLPVSVFNYFSFHHFLFDCDIWFHVSWLLLSLSSLLFLW